MSASGNPPRRAGAPEKRIDPSLPEHSREFAQALRELRTQCGSPSYDELGKHAHFSPATLSVAASGRRLPTLEVTTGFVTGCLRYASREQDLEQVLEQWRARWHEAKRKEELPKAQGDKSAPKQTATESGDTAPAQPDSKRRSRRGVRIRVAILLVLLLAGASITGYATGMFSSAPQVWHVRIVGTWSEEKKFHLGVYKYHTPDVPNDTDKSGYPEGESVPVTCLDYRRHVTDPSTQRKSPLWYRTPESRWIPGLYAEPQNLPDDPSPEEIPRCQ